MVAKRDVIQLSMDFYWSDNSGQWPTLLVRTPYGKNEILFASARFGSQTTP
jgi:predicted acyl esterase